MSEFAEEVLPEEPPADREIVQWMEPRPLTVGPAGLSATAAGAFAAGALAAVVVLGLMRWLGPDRRPWWER